MTTYDPACYETGKALASNGNCRIIHQVPENHEILSGLDTQEGWKFRKTGRLSQAGVIMRQFRCDGTKPAYAASFFAVETSSYAGKIE